MRYTLLFSLLICSCTGSLTERQRQMIKEEGPKREIRKISEAAILDAAYRYGLDITGSIDLTRADLEHQIDSIRQQEKVHVYLFDSTKRELLSYEKTILEGYHAVMNTALPKDNIQKISKDSLLYTKPWTKEGKLFVIGVRISQKTLILNGKI